MSPATKSLLPLAALLGLAAGWILRSPDSAPPPVTASAPAEPPAEQPAAPKPTTSLSPLGGAPNWSALDAWQETITRADFERLLTTIFTTGEGWRNFIAIDDREAVIATGTAATGLKFHLRFAEPGRDRLAPRHWRATAELPPAPADRPLDGLRIAIDPGHLGGEWAKMEERWFVVGHGSPVCEGDLTLAVAKLLKPKLEALGATVSLIRDSAAPLTPLRPESLLPETVGTAPNEALKAAQRLFYRTAEIRARAERVNAVLKPDLVLCLHFNAEPWGDPNAPALVDRTHFHLLLNGGYTDDELALADQRFEMLGKLLQRTHAEEADVGADVAAAFFRLTGLPPYTYPADARNARTVDGNPFLWARNLLANRLYDCPVIFLEPYVMNSRGDYARIQAGDYEGLREIDGKPQLSIFREYADALTEGLATHYRKHRDTP